MVEEGKTTAKSSVKAFTPNAHGGYKDPANDDDFNDDIGDVGFRNDQPRTKITDGLSRFTESPKAAAINRSLGYD